METEVKELPWEEYKEKFVEMLKNAAEQEPTIIHYPMLIWVELGEGQKEFEKGGREGFRKAFHIKAEQLIDVFYGPSTEEEKDKMWKDAEKAYNEKTGENHDTVRPVKRI